MASPATYVSFETLLGFTGWDAVKGYLFDQYLNNDTEIKRRADARERDELYGNRGDKYMNDLIKRAFDDDKNRRLRQALVPVTKWNAVTQRIVDELASVYNEPAKRRVGVDDATYQTLLEQIPLDIHMREVDRMLALHEDVWIQYRVRELYPEGPRSPALDITSPALFDAIAPPHDCTMHVGTLLHQFPRGACAETDHHYLVLTPFESIKLDKKLRIIPGGRGSWLTKDGRGFPKMPGFLASMRPASSRQRLLELSPLADVVAAHKGVWFQDTLLFKESKSVNKQTAYAGDTSSIIAGQQQDTEADVFLPEGVTPFPIDRGLEPEQFRDNSTHIAERAGTNHGLPPSVYNLADASSGAEIYLRRLPLRELRQRRILVLRQVERNVASTMSMVNGVDWLEYAFSMDGFECDFGEVQQPMTASELDATFITRKQNGLTSTYEEELDRNPDLKTKEKAKERVNARVADETELLAEKQDLQRMNGGVTTQVGDKLPEQNGADGQAAAAKKPGTP